MGCWLDTRGGSVGLKYHKQGQVMQDDAVDVVFVSVPLQSKGEQEEKENPELPQTPAWDFPSPPWHWAGQGDPWGRELCDSCLCCRDIPLVPCWCFCCGERAAGIAQRVSAHPCSPGFHPGAVEHWFILQ